MKNFFGNSDIVLAEPFAEIGIALLINVISTQNIRLFVILMISYTIWSEKTVNVWPLRSDYWVSVT